MWRLLEEDLLKHSRSVFLVRGMVLSGALVCLGCGGPAPLTVDMPLHLEEHLDAATIVGSEVPEEYTAFLEAQFEAHRSLAQLFTRSDPVALTPAQLRTLRALGYIQ